MRKVFKLKDLECANCAAKMEKDIGKLSSVNKATVSFMTQRLTIESDADDFSELINRAQTICSKYEPNCKIVC